MLDDERLRFHEGRRPRRKIPRQQVMTPGFHLRSACMDQQILGIKTSPRSAYTFSPSVRPKAESVCI